MINFDLARLCAIVTDAARLMDIDHIDITQKDGYSNIVTSADVAVQEYLKLQLAMLLPSSGFICEEEDVHDTRHDYLWIIDPIDGTANFSRGIAQCAISVGLWHSGEMLMGVVYIPRTGELFSAERGRGSTLNGRPIHVSARVFADSVLCTALPVYHKEYTDVCSAIITDAFKSCNDLRRFGAAAPELCYLACGRCDLYFEYLLSAWDFAAASLILTEAGGCLCDLNGHPLDLTRPSSVIAANRPDNLDTMTAIVKKHNDRRL